MSRIVCPLCRLVLDRQPPSWRCAQGHSFDVAREGYVNLLPVQQKKSRDPGDNVDMVKARRDFLAAGHYQPLRDGITALLAPLGATSILDIGCGEGYYTDALTTLAPEVIGLDVAKPAIQIAAKRSRAVTWLVASAAALPFDSAGLDLACTLFTPLQVPELHRVLKPDGHALIVTPAADHLLNLRHALFDEVRAYEPDKFLADFAAGFHVVERRELRCALSLDTQALKQLLTMTPYAWKARPEKRAALERSERFDTGAAFSLMLLRKRDRELKPVAGVSPA